MRVLIVHNAGRADSPSGETVAVEREARALAGDGVEVATHVVRWPASARALLWSARGYREVRRLIDAHRPSVVHVHGVLPALSTSVFDAARRAGVPCVQTLHNHRWTCVEGGLLRDGRFCDDCLRGGPIHGVRHGCARGSRAISGALALHNLIHVATGRLASLVDRFIAVSRFVRDKHIEAGFAAGQIAVKYNNVDIGPPSADYRPRSVFFAGRVDAAKGADLLVDVAARLGNHTFEIAGVGQACAPTARLTLRGRLTQPEVIEAIRRSAVVVVPSRAAESCPLVALEAMACGVPVVASDRGALPELIEASGGGYAVAPGGDALADAIARITRSPSLRAELGRAGRRFAERELSLERGAQRLLEIYREVLRARRPGGGRRRW